MRSREKGYLKNENSEIGNYKTGVDHCDLLLED
jgi:hypothetical protein